MPEIEYAKYTLAIEASQKYMPTDATTKTLIGFHNLDVFDTRDIKSKGFISHLDKS